MNASCPCPSLRPVDGTPRVLVRLQRYSRASTGILFLQMQTMRKNWVDILYWCGKLQNTVEDCGHRVSHAIGKIEEAHGKEAIDQQCWKDHAAGTRAHDAVTILEWLEDNKETYTRGGFNKFLDRLVTRKLLEYHFMNPDHGHAMELEVEDANKEKKMKHFPPHSLVHADWGM